MHKEYVLLTSALVLILFINGCAGSGGSATIQDSQALQKIKKVYLPHYLVHYGKNPRSIEDSSGVANSVLSFLQGKSINGFATLHEDSSVVATPVISFLQEQLNTIFVTVYGDRVDTNNIAWNIDAARRIGQKKHVDGIIFAELWYYMCDPKVIHNSYGSTYSSHADAYLKLTVLEASTGAVVAGCEFDTHEGKIYAIDNPPPVSQVTRDVITGCVDELKMAMEENNSPAL